MKMTSNIKMIRHVYYYDVYIYTYTHVFKFWNFDFEVVDDNNKDDSTKRFSHKNDNKMKINLYENRYFFKLQGVRS